MNKHLSAVVAVTACLFSVSATSAPGEYWEMTSKMEMEGMPFAMPANTMKVCIPKGGEKDPGKTSGDKDCQMTDIKTVGNKTTWKMRCNKDGEVMTGKGEQTTTGNSYQGKMQVTSRDMNMATVYSGKKLGGSCDTEEMIKKVKGQICDTSQRRNTSDWIYASSMILRPDATCADQRGQLCDRVRKDAPKDAETYTSLLMYEQQKENISVVKSCKLDMAATTRSVCKTLNGKNYSQLAAHCPAEAKEYREVQRRKECEGRSYTAETRAADLKKCLSGKNQKWEPEDGGQDEATAPRKSGKSPSSDILDGAKQLKGLLGF